MALFPATLELSLCAIILAVSLGILAMLGTGERAAACSATTRAPAGTLAATRVCVWSLMITELTSPIQSFLLFKYVVRLLTFSLKMQKVGSIFLG